MKVVPSLPGCWVRLRGSFAASGFVLGLLILGLNSTTSGADLRGARLFKSGPIQITADGTHVWCVNPDNDSVTRLDTASEQASEFLLPSTSGRHVPRGLSLKEDGSEVWVTCHDSDRVYVLDGADGSILARIDLPWGSGPFSIALSPDQQTALVTLHRGEALAVLDVASRRFTHHLQHLFWAPMGIAWAEGGRAAWVNHIFSPGEHPLQTRVDFSGPEPHVSTSMQIFAADPRHGSGLAAPYNVAEGGYLNVRGHPAQIPAASGRNELWLPTQYHNMNGDTPTPDSIVQSVVRHLNLSTRTMLTANNDKVILSALYVHNNVSGGAYLGPGWNVGAAGPIDLGFTVDGALACVLLELSRNLVLLPTSTVNLRPAGAPPLAEVKLGYRPIGVALSPVRSNAYVLNQLTRDISIVDLTGPSELKRVPVTPITGERFPADVLRGAQIFHSSDDPRISRSGKMACASCHINAEHDGRTWANQRLPGNHGPRATPSLLGLRLSAGPRDPATGFGQFHHSGDRDELQDFEHTFQGVQMGGTGFLGTNVQPELGPPNAGRSPDLDALARYMMSLDPLPRSPYRAPGGALTAAAIRGATFFTGLNRASHRADAGCARCHIPETGFCDLKFHDVGQRRDPNEKELNSRTPAWSVNTPSLVGAWATAPYTGSLNPSEAHHASEAMFTLIRDAVGRAGSVTNHGTPDGLSLRQIADLAEFVLSIDGNMTAAEVRAARDTVPPRIIRAELASLQRLDLWFSETVKPLGATNPANWRLTEGDGTPVTITRGLWDSQNGDHAVLLTQLRPHTSYLLKPAGPIYDDADAASGNAANAMDPADPANQRTFAVTDRLTITLGASGYENLTIPIHDAAMVGPSLATWAHDSVWLFPVSGGPGLNTAFLRFDWSAAFRSATGVSNAAQIVSASFRLQPDLGNSQTIQLRRCLQKWSDPATGGDFNSNPIGAPTWTASAQGTRNWNEPGAGRLGSDGSSTNDYFGTNDLAARIDATVAMPAINEPVEFRGALVTDAFRFWFTNPSVDYGYGLRLTSGSNLETKFARWESGVHADGPVLQLTYLVPGATPRLGIQRLDNAVTLTWPVDPAETVLESASALTGPWNAVNGAPTVINGTNTMTRSPDSSGEFFRLVLP
ncbi:MAG TPA: cytochrome c peroxidase [Verrucomicrobiae bacterium]|nr:cytochrome c peroxidase [Verrucomicrobiae bacterium]